MDRPATQGGIAASLPYRYVLFDHDAKFGNDVFEFLHASGTEPLQISIRSPWQNRLQHDGQDEHRAVHPVGLNDCGVDLIA